MTSGIYEIKNIINGNSYYGSACNFKQRVYDHFKLLRKNKHGNKHLQRAVNFYGINNFEMKLILTIKDKTKLLEYEQIYLDAFWDKGKNCYNICKFAGNTFGRKCKKSTKNKIRKAHKGRKHTQQSRNNMGKSHHKKVKSFNLVTNEILLFESIKDCASHHNVLACHITEVLKKRQYTCKNGTLRFEYVI